MRKQHKGQIMIECPNTIFYLYVNNERELSKVETFMSNIKSIKRLGLHDIYTWCNRQGIAYETQFHYHPEFSLWTNFKSYLMYSRQKMKYGFSIGSV